MWDSLLAVVFCECCHDPSWRQHLQNTAATRESHISARTEDSIQTPSNRERVCCPAGLIHSPTWTMDLTTDTFKLRDGIMDHYKTTTTACFFTRFEIGIFRSITISFIDVLRRSYRNISRTPTKNLLPIMFFTGMPSAHLQGFYFYIEEAQKELPSSSSSSSKLKGRSGRSL